MRVLYITGGGKCGTHVTAAHIHANWPGSTLHPTEFKTWRDDLQRTLRDKFIFHKPIPDIERFHALCPGGKSLVLLRHPAQHYMAWLSERARVLILNRSLHCPKHGEMHTFAMKLVLSGFAASTTATACWRFEDFTANAEQRLAMIEKLLDSESIGFDAPTTVHKSRLGWGGGIHRVYGNEFRAILTNAEIEALDRPETRIFYPNWTDDLLMRESSDEDRVRARFKLIVSDTRTLMLRRRNWWPKGKRFRLDVLIPALRASDKFADEMADRYLAGA